MLSSRYAKMLCRLAEHLVQHNHTAKAQQHSTALSIMIAPLCRKSNSIIFLQQKSCVRSIFVMWAHFNAKSYFFVYCGAEFAPWYPAERTWLSPLVKLLYNRYQRQKSPSCGTQLGDWFIPHKYYRQIRNTRKQRTQEWRKVSQSLQNALKSIRKCYKKYYSGLWEQNVASSSPVNRSKFLENCCFRKFLRY